MDGGRLERMEARVAERNSNKHSIRCRDSMNILLFFCFKSRVV